MRRFEEPVVEVQKLVVDDVITTSFTEDGNNSNCPNETGRT